MVKDILCTTVDSRVSVRGNQSQEELISQTALRTTRVFRILPSWGSQVDMSRDRILIVEYHASALLRYQVMRKP